MKKSKNNTTFFIILAVILNLSLVSCKDKSANVPSGTDQPVSIQAEAGEFVTGKSIKVPLIAWGADLITINANGRSGKTIKNSLFDQEKLNIELFREDVFSKQVDMFIKGEIAYLRGTMGMINTASERLSANDRTKPVVIFQHSWSAGGDALVVKSGINSVKDLKGKTVAIQSWGPHVDYFLKLLKDAQIKISDVNIVWTKDLYGTKDTPMAKLYQENVHAAFVIIPDALALTSNGTVGTGAEESVKGAKILLSTKTANRIISDVYAVRKDYFDSNRESVYKFVNALMRSEEEVRDMFKNKNTDEFRKLIQEGGRLLLDDPGAAADMEGMYYDAEMAGFNGNVNFLANKDFPRNCSRLSAEIQKSLIELGLIKKTTDILTADWDYNNLKTGLKYANVVVPSRFDPSKTAVVAEKISKTGDSSLFSFEIFFKPNQNTFTSAMYEEEFKRVIDFASTYGGALITVEGHSDPMGYLRKEKEGADSLVLKKIKQAAKNLSYGRANSVREELIRYASIKSITLDPNQFTIIGHGIESPAFSKPESEKEWLANMRVVFKIIQVEAEEEVFKPL